MQILRFSRVSALALLLTLSSYGQDRPVWRTAADVQEGVRGSVVGTVAGIDEARGQILLEADDDNGPRITIFSDSVSTQYYGFGGSINGQPEIFTGSQGLANVRAGDRLEIRGVGRANNGIRGDVISLRGRQVAASQTGVGTSRNPGSISTPSSTSASSADRVGPVEGVVQEVNAGEGRIVIVTDRREIMTVRTSDATPVNYRNETYRVANLEVGDRIRVEPAGSRTSGGELQARSITVTRAGQEGTVTPRATSLAGRVTRIDRTLDIINVDNGRTSTRVDVATATDSAGRRVRAYDFREGDHVDVTGRYSPTAADLFIASSVRFPDDVPGAAPTGGTSTPATGTVDVGSAGTGELAAVTIYGTVRETLVNSPQLMVRDSNGRTVRVNALDDFIVRSKAGTYMTADKLRVGDSIVIKAYRDSEGNYIAQGIRVR